MSRNETEIKTKLFNFVVVKGKENAVSAKIVNPAATFVTEVSLQKAPKYAETIFEI